MFKLFGPKWKEVFHFYYFTMDSDNKLAQLNTQEYKRLNICTKNMIYLIIFKSKSLTINF
jgi:hypothetical protein